MSQAAESKWSWLMNEQPPTTAPTSNQSIFIKNDWFAVGWACRGNEIPLVRHSAQSTNAASLFLHFFKKKLRKERLLDWFLSLHSQTNHLLNWIPGCSSCLRLSLSLRSIGGCPAHNPPKRKEDKNNPPSIQHFQFNHQSNKLKINLMGLNGRKVLELICSLCLLPWAEPLAAGGP